MQHEDWKLVKKEPLFLYCCCLCYFSPHFYGPILRPCLWWMIAKNQLDIYGFCGLWIHIGWNSFWINILSLGFCKTATQKSWAIPLLTNAEKKIKNEHFHSKKTWTHFIIGRYGSAENILIVDYDSFHLYLFDFPFIYQFYSTMTTLVKSTCWNPADLFILKSFHQHLKLFW